MTNPIRMVLDIEPMPAPRPRFRAITVRGKTIVNAYNPKAYTEWLKQAADAANVALDGLLQHLPPETFPLRGPITVGLIVAVTRPKTTKLAAPKPDIDNYAKATLDALTKACVWEDDCQVVFLAVHKKWDDGGSISIEIRTGDPTQ